jgi:Zn-dependent M28 family amino/carboxypeptidase
VGSQHYAREARDRGDNIIAVINFDAIGYWEEGLPRDLNILFNSTSEFLADTILLISDKYTTSMVSKNSESFGYGSDHQSFWSNGFSAIWLFEAGNDLELSPYINTSDDIIDHVNRSFLNDNIRVGIVAAAYLAQPVSNIVVP